MKGNSPPEATILAAMSTVPLTAQHLSQSRRWTAIGLVVAFFGMPIIIGLFSATQIPWTMRNVALRELALFGLAGGLAFIIRNKERLGWESVGLQRPAAGNTALWVLITILGVAFSIAVAFGLIKLLKLSVGSSDSAKYELLPLWVLMLAIGRAGFIEEFFYRGYAIERLQCLTGSRVIAAAIPLLLFAIFHYRQGWAGIIIAILTGAVLTGVYLFKRNLWITITAHFLVDFIPNIILPLFLSK